MKAYFDTNIVSGIAKGDIEPEELRAAEQLLALFEDGKINLFTSHVTKNEIGKIPLGYRTKHENVLRTLESLPTADYLALDIMRLNPASLGVMQHTIFEKLLELLKDKEDAMHIFQSSQNDIVDFVTVDYKTILSKKKDIFNICGVDVACPTEFISKLN